LALAASQALRRFLTRGAHLVIRQAENRGHAALPDRYRFLHRLGPKTNQGYRILECNDTGGNQRRIFAETVSGNHCRRFAAGRNPCAINRDSGSEHHRLRIGGEVQVFFRSFGNQFAEIEAHRIGCLGNRLPDHRVIGEPVQHPDGLRPLAGKNKCEFSHALFLLERITCAQGRRPR
jgi:hypothetical protein